MAYMGTSNTWKRWGFVLSACCESRPCPRADVFVFSEQVAQITRQSQTAVLQQLSELEQGIALARSYRAAAQIVDLSLLQLWTSSTPAFRPMPSRTSFRNSKHYSNVLLQLLRSSKLLRWARRLTYLCPDRCTNLSVTTIFAGTRRQATQSLVQTDRQIAV